MIRDLADKLTDWFYDDEVSASVDYMLDVVKACDGELADAADDYTSYLVQLADHLRFADVALAHRLDEQARIEVQEALFVLRQAQVAGIRLRYRDDPQTAIEVLARVIQDD